MSFVAGTAYACRTTCCLCLSSNCTVSAVACAMLVSLPSEEAAIPPPVL